MDCAATYQYTATGAGSVLKCISSDSGAVVYRVVSMGLILRQYWPVCVEVLRPSQPNGVMSSAVS